MLGQVHGRPAPGWMIQLQWHTPARGWACTFRQWPPSNSSFPGFLCHWGCGLQQSTTPYTPWISALPLLLLPTSSLNPAYDWPQGSDPFPITWTPCLCNQPGLPCACTSVGFPGGSVVKNLPAKAGSTQGWEDILEGRAWWPTPVFWPGGSHGQRSLVGYRPGGGKDLQWGLIPHIKKVIGFIEITGSI